MTRERESIEADEDHPCMACGKPTRRYVVVDWSWSCGTECDAILDAQLDKDLDEIAHLKAASPPPEPDEAIGFRTEGFPR